MIERSSGVLLHLTSLPSPYGVGTMGRAAYAFADFLRDAGQRYWQMLPLGPTGYGDSPYQSFSSFAGNPNLIDLDLLVEDGLLRPESLDGLAGDDPRQVDYGRLHRTRMPVLDQAYRAGWARDREAVAAFERENPWLADYALFMAAKRHFGMKCWVDWPDELLRRHDPGAVAWYQNLLRDDVRFYTYLQFLFFRQWDALREHIHARGLRIIGDLPFYVALDSADVWAEPKFFQLDAEGKPREVAGVPPDDFTADGQLWGNPLYDFDRMAADGYGWWIRRVGGAARLFDVVRIDHFRGFESYWAVPAGEPTARNGCWRKGPGMALVGALTAWFDELDFIAEDLGYQTEAVERLVAESGLPGMKVLEFAFDAREPSDHLPHAYPPNTVCYVGTHDNETAAQWFAGLGPDDRAHAVRYLGLNEDEGVVNGLIRGGAASAATLFVVQMQDWLGLGADCRMNAPGTAAGNWRFRLLPGEADKKLALRMRELTARYGRAAEQG